MTPDDPDYERARTLWNATADGRPAVIVRCHTVADVAAAVRLIRRAGVPLAVRGGGHSLPGFSTCEDGVVIDLNSMRSVHVGPGRRIAEVGPGATWHDVDHACAAHGLATTGGLISTTGVAGLALGGGIGWLPRRYGLTCDNLRVAEVVTADAEVVEADDDLRWGLRGGGGNFGIVSRFTFDLHPVATVLGGLLAFPLDRGQQVLAAFREWAAEAPDEATLLVSIMTAPEPFVPGDRRTEGAGAARVLVRRPRRRRGRARPAAHSRPGPLTTTDRCPTSPCRACSTAPPRSGCATTTAAATSPSSPTTSSPSRCGRARGSRRRCRRSTSTRWAARSDAQARGRPRSAATTRAIHLQPRLHLVRRRRGRRPRRREPRVGR